MSLSPTTTDSTSTMTITITPTHLIPLAGALVVSFDKNYSTAVSNNMIINSVPTCVGVSVFLWINRTTLPPTYIAV